MLCMYYYVDKIYDVIIPYTHNTAHVMILPLEIIIIIHYTIRLTYNTFNNHLLREGYALLKCFSLYLYSFTLFLLNSCKLLSLHQHPQHSKYNNYTKFEN